MAPYGLYQLNPLTGPLFAWFDQLVSKWAGGGEPAEAPERGSQKTGSEAR